MQRETLTVKEAADVIGICEDTLYVMIRQKQIPHFRAGRKIKLRYSTLLKWMETQEDASISA